MDYAEQLKVDNVASSLFLAPSRGEDDDLYVVLIYAKVIKYLPMLTMLVKAPVEEIHTFEKLCSMLRLPSGGLIAIEGFCCSGKTSLAEKLAHELHALLVHTDEYCTPVGDPLSYACSVEISHLAQVLRNPESLQLVIVEGICLRDVMDKCGVNPEIYVYIKRVSSNGIWHDSFYLDAYKVEGDSSESEPHASDLAYHRKRMPHEEADLIFINKIP
jgi:hypothetical protein